MNLLTELFPLLFLTSIPTPGFSYQDDITSSEARELYETLVIKPIQEPCNNTTFVVVEDIIDRIVDTSAPTDQPSTMPPTTQQPTLSPSMPSQKPTSSTPTLSTETPTETPTQAPNVRKRRTIG